MTLLRFDPYRSFESMFKRMNQFINEFEKGINIETGSFTPRVDIFEDNDNLYLIAEVPGIPKGDVKVSISEDNILTLKGEKKVQSDGENLTPIRNERIFGSFERSFVLPENVDINSVVASYNDGLLNVTIKKKEPEKPKEIEINIQ